MSSGDHIKTQTRKQYRSASPQNQRTNQTHTASLLLFLVEIHEGLFLLSRFLWNSELSERRLTLSTYFELWPTFHLVKKNHQRTLRTENLHRRQRRIKLLLSLEPSNPRTLEPSNPRTLPKLEVTTVQSPSKIAPSKEEKGPRRKIDVFKWSLEKGFTLAGSFDTLSEVAKFVWVKHPANVSPSIDSWKIYKWEFKFISRKV